MKHTKKLAMLLCGVMGIGMLVSSCGENKSSVQKVTVWSQDSHSKSVVTKLIDGWNNNEGKELGVELEYTVKEGDIQQATEMAFASGQGPDLYSSAIIDKNLAAGNIKSIEDISGGKEWIESEYSDYNLSRSEFMGPDGKIYRLPGNINTFGLVYNKDMFKKYGIVDENGEPTPPETFEEVREYAKRMTDPSKQDYGIIMPMKWGAFYDVDIKQLLIGSTGMNIFDPVKGEYNMDGLKPIWEMYTGIKEDGSNFPGSETLDNDAARAYFAERNIGMKFAGSFDVGVFNKQFPAKCDWGVAPLPVADKNARHKQHMGVGGGYAISPQCVERIGDDAALKILKFLYGKDLARELYKEGMSIYYDSSATADVTPNDGLTGWKEFSSFVDISTDGYDCPSSDITGQKNAKAVFTEDVWTGAVDADAAIADLNKRMNDGMKKYYDENKDKDFNRYLIPDWKNEVISK